MNEPILTGLSANKGIASGPVRVILDPSDVHKIHFGEILVTKTLSFAFIPALVKAIAIIADEQGYMTHTARIAGELKVPCVLNTKEATTLLKDGQIVTVDGDYGHIYEGGKEVNHG